MKEREYINKIFDENKLSLKAEKLFKEIINLPVKKREKIINLFLRLKKTAGLDIGLLALYRQQVNCGFVLSDPLKEKKIKEVFDNKTGIKFVLSFNPDRELRKNHKVLIERGIIAKDIDNSKLINKKNGIACYLCWRNILLQNPSEIIIKIKLNNEFFFLGANFAYITNNHFTIMNSKHIPQIYRKKILDIGLSLLDKTKGRFRIIYNGRAGASIKEHEHLQSTTEEFPIEKIDKGEKIMEIENTRIYNPFYYLPLYIFESYNRDKLTDIIDRIISGWKKIDKNNTINLIFLRQNGQYSIFVFLRDQNKLISEGKTGALASFEVGGRMVFSTEQEKKIFDEGSILTINRLLKDISPENEKVEILRKKILKYNRG